MSIPPTHTDTPEGALQRVVQFFEHLQPADVARMAELYTIDAQFKDPFHEVHGLAAIEGIFAHMFKTLHTPRFVIIAQVQQGTQCFVTWDFVFALHGAAASRRYTIHGASHLVLRQDNGTWRVAVHRDYWDAAEELYEKLPILGSLMRWLKRRMRGG